MLKEEKTYCLSSYNFYESFLDADFACKTDIRCHAVLDFECDKKGPFKLCSIPVTLEVSERGSCIYRKGKTLLGLLIPRPLTTGNMSPLLGDKNFNQIYPFQSRSEKLMVTMKLLNSNPNWGTGYLYGSHGIKHQVLISSRPLLYNSYK